MHVLSFPTDYNFRNRLISKFEGMRGKSSDCTTESNIIEIVKKLK